MMNRRGALIGLILAIGFTDSAINPTGAEEWTVQHGKDGLPIELMPRRYADHRSAYVTWRLVSTAKSCRDTVPEAQNAMDLFAEVFSAYDVPRDERVELGLRFIALALRLPEVTDAAQCRAALAEAERLGREFLRSRGN